MKQNPINQAISSNLTIMEMHLMNMLDNVQAAREYINEGKTDATVGSLMCSENAYSELKTLFDAIRVIHRNADLVHREED